LTKNSFAGFIQGNTLASVLDTLATVRDTEGAYFGGLPQDGECGYAFFFSSYGWPFTFRIEF